MTRLGIETGPLSIPSSLQTQNTKSNSLIRLFLPTKAHSTLQANTVDDAILLVNAFIANKVSNKATGLEVVTYTPVIIYS